MRKTLPIVVIFIALITNIFCDCVDNDYYNGYLIDASAINFDIDGGKDSVHITNNEAVIINATDYDWHGNSLKTTTYTPNEAKDSVEGEWFKCVKVVHDEIFQYYKITVKPNTTGKNRKADINLRGTEPRTSGEGKRYYCEETLSIYQDAK